MLLPFFIQGVKLYSVGDKRRALLVDDFPCYDAASNQREIHLLARLARIDGHGPTLGEILDIVGGDEGLQHDIDDVAPLGKAAGDITTFAVSPGFDHNGSGRSQSAGRVSFQIGLRNGDRRIHGRLPGDDHTSAD